MIELICGTIFVKMPTPVKSVKSNVSIEYPTNRTEMTIEIIVTAIAVPLFKLKVNGPNFILKCLGCTIMLSVVLEILFPSKSI